jgi:hypothetical protein
MTEHQNISALVLMNKVQEAIISSLRGEAAKQPKELEFKLLNESRKFTIHISSFIDDLVEGQANV